MPRPTPSLAIQQGAGITHRKCQESLAVAVLRSTPVTTKGPSQLLHTFCTKAPIRLLHFSKLPQRSRFFSFSTHSDSSALSHVVPLFTMAATLPTHPPLPPHPRISHRYPSVYLSNYLFPRFYSDSATQTQIIVTREGEFDARQHHSGRCTECWGKSAHVFPPDILHRLFTELGSTFPDPGGCCSLGSSGASVQPPRPLLLSRLACLL